MLGELCIVENCKNEQLPGCRYCASCYKVHKRENAKKHYARKKKGSGICAVCGEPYTKTNAQQKYCTKCYDKIKHATVSTRCPSPYHRTRDHSTEHRNLARAMHLIESEENEVVHHINLNPRDNSETNLLVMTYSSHATFHHYLSAAIVTHPDKTVEELTWDILKERNIPYKKLT